MAAPARISVLCSGNGSNLQALIDACESGRIPGNIVRVTVNRKTAYATTRAEKAGIPTDYFNLVKDGFQVSGEKDPLKIKEARSKYDSALAQRIMKDDPELVVLAGWMHIFSEAFLRPLKAVGVSVINLHPALPGKYDGAGAIERAFEDFKAAKLENNTTGLMIHEVIEQVDRGDTILQQTIKIEEGDTLEDLTNRIHGLEHELIVKATALKSQEIMDKRPAHP
ncbi:phosphoribosylglycinamide formyltransferase [Apiospora aurea]|uniref:phosphoribosylglycinamide formyltransferase 1 n=1 Tax=Apiospora aurea TaxID=335848 RepID=A0ABR1QB99_9PEZI